MAADLTFIHDEHRNIARVLKELENVARDDDALRRAARADLLASILYYLRVYPYAVHHPKEERYLFPAVAANDAAGRRTVDELHREHAEGYAMLQRTEIAAAEGDAGLARLKAAILAYVAHEFGHMRREETDVLPIAERCLSADAATTMRRQFAGHADPMFGDNVHAGFEALFRHITAKA
jgi:hemerythrin-like domain-containing protein